MFIKCCHVPHSLGDSTYNPYNKVERCLSGCLYRRILLTALQGIFHKTWLKHLETQLNEPTNQNSTKVPKVVNPTNTKKLI